MTTWVWQTLDEVAQQLDGILFSDYIKRQSGLISSVMETGISSTSWPTIPKPTGVHAFVYESLLSLVRVHARVRAVAKPLVSRAILALVENLATTTLSAFEAIPRFGLGGMLQATLEIEFIHQTMAQYISPEAEGTLKKVYETISRKYSRRSEDADLTAELENVKRTLVESRKATALEFLCFRRVRSKKDPASASGPAAAHTAASAG